MLRASQLSLIASAAAASGVGGGFLAKTAASERCYLNQDMCNISGMPRGSNTFVYPGGNTSCVSPEEPEYWFQVVPGDLDKLVLNFQGDTEGDACWQTSTFRCLEKPVAESKGMFDKGQKSNPFLNYTIVNVVYCSGDLHMGMSKKGSQVQLGVTNTESVIAWTLDNFPDMESLVISGSGAGSLEAQILAKHLLTRFEGTFAHGLVLTDSFFGVRPPSPINNSKLLNQYNFCDTPMIQEDDLVERCRAGSLTVMDMFVNAMRSFPGVSFAAISSKTDRIQIGYYRAWAEIEDERTGERNFDGPEHFLVHLNNIFRRYNEQPNFVSYLVDGGSHGFLDAGILYTADPQGSGGRGLVARPKLVDWISSLLAKNATAASVCSGRLFQFSSWEKWGAGDMFCDESQHGKALLLT